MTEETAKKKWCPFARNASDENYGAQNRTNIGTPDTASMCLGSTCMAWRSIGNATSGFCGLAGKP